ncbi:unnamed protein product [Protopolystoma xenopodis]|uniref:Uncharacterized protein n=1 Tax=Protopolystoma xenopodis TaxID=117903 RepID=A0A3S5AS00_9PLAT|nr:unnamed protein product [Protopolystoma xenopodis]
MHLSHQLPPTEFVSGSGSKSSPQESREICLTRALDAFRRCQQLWEIRHRLLGPATDQNADVNKGDSNQADQLDTEEPDSVTCSREMAQLLPAKLQHMKNAS